MEEKDLRPDPDALLKEIEKDDVKKGRLKIFLGYAPGVGKTYAMLNEAHVLKKRGVDVVAGIVETHKRADTDALLAGLEVIPRKSIEYKGLLVSEMDLDAILTRHPAVVLVDELAHTNIEGSRHPKRYQDIEELLEHGIDVHTTVNIQHFESMNDAVAKITGVRMQETLPDTFFDRTDEVQVVDIPWEELFQRLKEGKVYFPAQAQRAIDNFFQRGNLFALRELMLTLVARKMDSELINYMRAKAIAGPWPATEKLVVCIADSPYAKQLIRKAYAIAKNVHAEWYAVYVLPTGLTEPSGRAKIYLTDALNLAEELGAKIMTLSGDDVAEEIIRFATENNITRIVIGKPLRPAIVEFFKRSPTSRLLRAAGDFELHLITPTIEEKKEDILPPPRRAAFNVSPYLKALGMIVMITMINLILQRIVDPSSLVYIYLIATSVSALLFGMWPSIFTSIVSLLIYDFLFTIPRYNFTMKDPKEIINVLVFLFTAIIIGQLVKIVKKQNIALQLRLERVVLIEEMSKEFLTLPPLEQLVEGLAAFSQETMNTLAFLRTTIINDISNITIKYIQKVINVPCFVLFKEKKGDLQLWAKSNPDLEINQNDLAVAKWTFAHGEIAGAGTETLPSIPYCFLPIKSQDEEILGVVGMQYEFKNLLPEQRRILGTISNLTSLVAARWVKI
ncbi:MAG: two-component sensor histidine kinase [Deltaproteobacteria bacterium HGW-Deltaproteobacteria-1]|jgi:two-component system sensor histidine kinase KdpD|nr:MAG: two-component sensor histidine kinase [Deltaproteobacteria bacterium HGW-Deltaproteobacteria-1]